MTKLVVALLTIGLTLGLVGVVVSALSGGVWLPLLGTVALSTVGVWVLVLVQRRSSHD